MKSLGALLAGLAACFTPFALAQSPAWKIVDLGRNASNVTTIRPAAINNRGQIAGQLVHFVPDAFSPPFQNQSFAFIYRDRRFDEIAGGGEESSATSPALNNEGQVTWFSTNGRGQVFDYRTRIDTPMPPRMATTFPTAYPWGIADTGTVVGMSQNQPVISTGGTTTALPLPGSDTSGQAQAINRSGDIVGRSVGAATQAVLWRNQVPQVLGTLGGANAAAIALNDAGDVVGWANTASGEQHAFVHSGGMMRDLGTLGGTMSAATGINSRGQIVGLSTRADNTRFYPFLYENGTMIDLEAWGPFAQIGCERWLTGNFEFGSAISATGIAINDHGHIAGGCDVGGGSTAHLIVISTAERYFPLAFDFNDDARGDILWRHTDGSAALWLMDGIALVRSAGILPAGTGWVASHVSDFNRDGKADTVWSHPDGRMAISLMDGTDASNTTQLLNAGNGWSVVHAGDLDQDGKADLVFRHTSGAVAAWLMDGFMVKAGATLLGGGTGWHVERLADFDADGRADLLWVHDDGRAAIWLMNGLAVKSGAQILNGGSGWAPIQASDLDLDGQADILWRHTDGSVAVWTMAGTSMRTGQTLLGPGSGWTATQVGRADSRFTTIFWQHADGSVAGWRIAAAPGGIAMVDGRTLRSAGSGWRIARLVRIDGNVYDDIAWQHDDGRSEAWVMDGLDTVVTGGLLGPGTGWSVSTVSQ